VDLEVSGGNAGDELRYDLFSLGVGEIAFDGDYEPFIQ
jgi:hypothetical protein